MKDPKQFMNPYLAGFLLGLVVIASFYLTGRGLGASGAVKSGVVAVVETVAPEHAESNDYYRGYLESHEGIPLKAFLVFLLVGVLIGGQVSGARSNRLSLRIEHGPNTSTRIRIIAALFGGLLFGFGAQLGRGCTSGAALSGMAVLSTAGFVSMLSIFGSGFIFAYFFRKLWI
jgi:uncharacterized membrane protein YedE/YeeE